MTFLLAALSIPALLQAIIYLLILGIVVWAAFALLASLGVAIPEPIRILIIALVALVGVLLLWQLLL